MRRALESARAGLRYISEKQKGEVSANRKPHARAIPAPGAEACKFERCLENLAELHIDNGI
eukprot:5832211-Pyramimonas_sp.AAC.1